MLLLHQSLPDAALAVLFVRDEDLDRGGLPPAPRADAAGVLAPLDPRAGGTWFGVSARGFAAGLVNRRGDPLPLDARSRGQLLLAALQQPSATAALDFAAAESATRPYGGCRMFAGDGAGLAWMDLPPGGPRAPRRPLTPGAWLLRHTRAPVAAPAPFPPRAGERREAWLVRALALLAAHEPAAAPLCHHGAGHGSVDVSFAALDGSGRPFVFRHGGGAPCRATLADHSAALAPPPAS